MINTCATTIREVCLKLVSSLYWLNLLVKGYTPMREFGGSLMWGGK